MTNTESNVHDVPDTPDESPEQIDVTDIQALITDVMANVEEVVVGGRDEIEHIMTALLGQGHVLIEDVPGVGKTMLARSVAKSFDGSFKRIQFTPDLLPSDVTGSYVYNEQNETFEFRAGPVFANIVLGDEINRAPPKTQSALLEAMEEEQVTVDGTTHELPVPFTVIATQNTVEGDRAYELPMAELDRFMKRISLGYPADEEETDLLGRIVGGHPIEEITPVASRADLAAARQTTTHVDVSKEVREYVANLVGYTRDHAELGASPRGSIVLLRAAQARAILDGREYVIPDDVQVEAPFVLPHRLQAGGADPEQLVEEALERVPVE